MHTANDTQGAFRMRMQGSMDGAASPGTDLTKESIMPNLPQSNDDLPYGQQPQPQRDSENNELETFEQSEDSPTDDPATRNAVRRPNPTAMVKKNCDKARL